MTRYEGSRTILVNEAMFWKLRSIPLLETVEGTVSSVIPVPEKADAPMLVTFLRSIDLRAVQPLNMLSGMDVMSSDSVTELSLVQPLNMLFAATEPSGNTKLSRAVQPLNMLDLNVLTPPRSMFSSEVQLLNMLLAPALSRLGRAMLVREEHPEKALSSMKLTFSGMSTDVSELHPLNALFPR